MRRARSRTSSTRDTSQVENQGKNIEAVILIQKLAKQSSNRTKGKTLHWYLKQTLTEINSKTEQRKITQNKALKWKTGADRDIDWRSRKPGFLYGFDYHHTVSAIINIKGYIKLLSYNLKKTPTVIKSSSGSKWNIPRLSQHRRFYFIFFLAFSFNILLIDRDQWSDLSARLLLSCILIIIHFLCKISDSSKDTFIKLLYLLYITKLGFSSFYANFTNIPTAEMTSFNSLHKFNVKYFSAVWQKISI